MTQVRKAGIASLAVVAIMASTGLVGLTAGASTAAAASRFTVTAAPASVTANGTSTTKLTVHVPAKYSVDQVVTFRLAAQPKGRSCGRLRRATGPAVGLTYTTTYTASRTVGLCTVTAILAKRPAVRAWLLVAQTDPGLAGYRYQVQISAVKPDSGPAHVAPRFLSKTCAQRAKLCAQFLLTVKFHQAATGVNVPISDDPIGTICVVNPGDAPSQAGCGVMRLSATATDVNGQMTLSYYGGSAPGTYHIYAVDGTTGARSSEVAIHQF